MDNRYFEIASIIRETESSQTKLDGNYPGEYGPISLIRAYNSSYFISDGSQSNLPYNPDEHTLIVTDNNKKIYRVGDTISTTSSETKTLYFSDGSVSELKPNSSLTISELDFKNPKNNLLTTVKLFLSSGTIFTKATALNSDSDFEIYTADTTAAVRGTIFSISYISGKTTVSVLKGQVEVQTKSNTPSNLNPITPGTGKVIDTEKQTENNISVTVIDSTIKTQLEIFTNVKNVGNEPIKNVTFVEYTSDNCDGTPDGDSKNFWNIGSVNYGNTCPSSESFTCNNGTWENSTGKDKSNYTFTNCTVGPANNCTATTKTIGSHIYNIPSINHSQNQTSTTNKNENNGNFRYTINTSCNNGTLTYSSENGPNVVSCNTGYKIEGNSCVLDTPPGNFFDWNSEIPNQDDPYTINGFVKINYKSGSSETLYVTKIKNTKKTGSTILLKFYGPNKSINTSLIKNIEILETISGLGCNACPEGKSYRSGSKVSCLGSDKYKRCSNIEGNPICAEKSGPFACRFEDKNWSGIKK